MSKKLYTGLNVGGSSILVIFVLLCLTTFATLSLVSANADYRLTLRAAAVSNYYYEADGKAEEMLALIDLHLQNCDLVEDAADYFEQVTALSQRMDVDFLPLAPNRYLAFYQVSITDSQLLFVELELPYPPNGQDGRYHITGWKVVNTAPLPGIEFDDQAIDLWSGEPFI